MNIGGSRRLLGAGSVVLAAAAGVVGVVIFANPAGAWHATLAGHAVCDTSTGTYTVTYSGESTNAGTVTVKDSTPSDSSVSKPNPSHVSDHGSFTIIQSGIPATETKASLTAHVTWDQQSSENGDASSGDVPLPSGCMPPPQNATTENPSFTNGDCASPTSTYTIPDVKGVDYQVNGQTVSAGTHDATPGASVEIKAVAEKGFQLSGETDWKHEFPALPSVCTGTAPHFTDASCAAPQATYTIPVTDGIQYWVDGKQATARTHTVANGSSVKITAIAADGHALTGTTSWTHSFPNVPATCAIASHTSTPSFADTTCTSSGTYTIPSSDTAVYTVNGTPAVPGTHSATAGSTVTVTASAKAGHSLVGTTTWTHTYPQAPTCGAPASLANTGPDAPVGQTTLIAGLLALVGTLCLLAGRRPSAARHRASKV